jgi:hypothetical protein
MIPSHHNGENHMKAKNTYRSIGALAILATGVVACGSDSKSGSAGDAASACPADIVFQTDWYPELEHGGTYQLIGPGGTASKDKLSYSGPIQPQYAVPGVKTITIKAISDVQNSQVLLKGGAMFAYITTSDIIKDSAAVPMVQIAKTLELDPQMVMWDPAQNDIKKPEDIAASGAKVLHFPGTSYIDYMIGKGYMTKAQSNDSYNGSDAEWVAQSGNFFQQGFATNEVYKYEHEVQWKDGKPAPVAFYTVGDMGFPNYPAAIAMLQENKTKMAGCLKAFVPKMQQAWVDFMKDPTPVTDKMIEINKTYDTFWSLSKELNTAGIKLVEDKGFAKNSADGTYCSFDDARVKELFELLKPIYEAEGTKIAANADGLSTNEFCKGAPGR